MVYNTTVFCTTSFEGVHCYKDAPGKVLYLRDSHRHVFGVRVEMEVYHDDREVEFIILKHMINRWIREAYATDEDNVAMLGQRSCEQVGAYIAGRLIEEFGQRKVTVTVDEDGENGAVVRCNGGADDGR